MVEKKISDVISRVAWGYVLLHAHINLGPVDILPDWLGYLLFLSAIKTIQKEQPTAKLLQPLAVILAIWNIVTIFVENIQGVSVLITVLSLYFHFQFLTDLANLAEKHECSESTKILSLRTVRTILMTIFALPFPWDEMGVISVGLIGANLVVVIWICVVLFGFKRSLSARME